jgi:hypothetical protein
MTLAQFAILLSAGGVVLTGWLAAIFVVDPVRGMARVSHRLEDLPKVMADRYIAFMALAAGATWYGDLAVIAYLFAVFAFMALADAVIYVRVNKPFLPHLLAGIAAACVALVALFAQTNGAA